jgi:hypothetical protein
MLRTECRVAGKVLGEGLRMPQEPDEARSLPGKLLALRALLSEDRCAMNRFVRSRNHGRAFVAALVFAAFFWTLALSASPRLHARIHPDANGADHTCAVTLIASGSCDHVAQSPLIGPADFISQFARVPALTSIWVRPLFLNAHIFAHAPPALAS